LNERNEYTYVIAAGKRCQECITKKKQEFQKHDDVRQEYERLDNLRLQHLLTKDEPGEDKENLDEKLQAAKEALEGLPQIADMDKDIAQLNEQLLQITELIIAAAKIEHCDAELRAQTIMAFKADTTMDRWDQVRALTPEEEWAQVKEELVVYVLRHDTNIKEKIELLLKDGLYKQVIDVFPKPSGDLDELDLLLKVYKTIEEKDPGSLERMIPVVSRYMKRYYQEQKYDKMEPLLDRFQRRFPAVIVSLFTHACDMVMFDIMPSQYSSFVTMLRDVKHRLESINRHDDWNAFFVAFKKKHTGKKKLIQMVNLIGDSVWDLENKIAAERPRKKQKVKDEVVKDEKQEKKREGRKRGKKRKKGEDQ